MAPLALGVGRERGRAVTARPEGQDRHANKQQQILSENRNPCYPFVMTPIASPPPMTAPEAGNSLAHPLYASVMALIRRKRPKKKKCLGGRRNPLKRPISDKEIQANPSFFSWKNLAGAWAGLAGFCRIWRRL
jgi:hypothetical protein